MQLTDLQVSARNAVAKFAGHTRGHAATLVSGLSAETCQAIVAATKLGDDKKIAAEVTAQLKAGDGERLAAHKADVQREHDESDKATGLVKKGKGKAGKKAGEAAEVSPPAAETEIPAEINEAPAPPAAEEKAPPKKRGKK